MGELKMAGQAEGNGQEVLTEKEAAEVLRISPETLRRYRLQGRVGYLRIARRVVCYARWQIDEFLEKVAVPAKRR